ncbi:class I SAM-dependent methyltransferase [Pseudonocardia sp. H11422]|uniref:class I SAM-dependent methyltransferase n=1 Tax=Pseudonocardia sp. H11422 TaxID=2835866 RepID=UPI001BDCBE59|nr:methyltransferase domain-containing protein [Pseudonocardia sp. H11422]
MPRSVLSPSVHDALAALPAYSRDAAVYDVRTRAFETYRRHLVDLLPIEPGDVVLDVGCGTGLCFALLQERVGRGGTVVGVDLSPDMLDVAAKRVAEQGWDNVVLIEAAVEDVDLPDGTDHALFCAVHDVLQSSEALDNVVEHVRAGGSVAAGGGKWAPVWAVALNAGVLALHAPYVRDFTGFERPWAHLADRVPGLDVREVAMGAGYLAAGRVQVSRRER